jgi:hypothetical protein
MINLEQHKIYLEDRGIEVIPYDIVQQYVVQLQVKILDETQSALTLLNDSLEGVSEDFQKLTDLLDFNDSDKI